MFFEIGTLNFIINLFKTNSSISGS